ncbi:MAG: DUF695 domain-containing protein [Prevotella sp.]|nr:DUF695 domain-containing protein [Prevotella sp.]
MIRLFLVAFGLLLSLLFCAGADNKTVKIPEREFVVRTSTSGNKPALIVANTSLKKFEHKELYGWTCSLVISFKETTIDGMPTTEESDFVYNYIEELDKKIKGDAKQPNALYLARITWNGTCEVIWQVKDPKAVHEYLGGIITNKTYPRELDYQIEYDAKWKNVVTYLLL